MKQLVNLGPVLMKLFGDTYQIKTAIETTTDGEAITTYSEPIEVLCAVLPLQGQALRNTPDGEYTIEDKTIVTTPPTVLNNGDIITYKTKEYEIRRYTEVSDIVGISIYLGKLL